MPIPESQLQTWSGQGAITTSSSTYATIRQALEDTTAPYASKNYKIFLQGSYGNDTNIYADSDVDIVIKTTATFYYDVNNLPDTDRKFFDSFFPAGTYAYGDFKRDVMAQLTKKFGTAVRPGHKAIYINGKDSRREADVIAALQFRRYFRFQGEYNQDYVDGICFWDDKNNQIINYPQQHSANCTSKHQMTLQRFKPMVRIFKNMRNSMIAKGYLQEGIAPSYFLEGMLYNVPNEYFTSNLGDTVVACINWIVDSDRKTLVCANEQYFLCHSSSLVTWRAELLQTYLNAVIKFWTEF